MADSTPSKWKKLLKNIKAFLPSLKVPFLIFTALFLFKGVFEDLSSTIFVKPLLSKFSKSYIADAIFLLGSIFCLSKSYYWNKKKFTIPNTIISTSFLIFSVYISYRFSQKVWVFKSLEINPSIKYLDIIPLFCFSVILSQIFRLKNKPPAEQNLNTGFQLDKPLGKTEPDLLGREKIAENIAEKINKTTIQESSLAIGILGEWGSGKTSFLDLIERYLDKESIIIKFNPWINQDSKSIIKDFFNALGEELSKYHFNVSSVLKDYSDILSGVGDNNLNKILSPLLKFISQKESVASEFDKINTIIKNINKRIIIFIDDVDRLHKDEIIQVMKLIRNSANFANTTFIVAYDRNYLVSAIRDINFHASENYLEKIFQVEVSLPNFEREKIKDKIKILLEPHLLEHDKQFLNINNISELSYLVSIFSSENNVFNLNIISTLRDVTRFVNSFLLSYNLLKGETIFKDLFHVEILRLAYPEVYRILFFEKDKVLSKKISGNQKDFYYSLKYPDDHVNNTLREGRIYIPPTIVSHIEKIYNEFDIEKIVSLLNIIFPSSNYDSKIKRLSIISPSSFERYSHYRLLDSNLSYVEFSNARQNNPIEVFYEKIDTWIDKGLKSDVNDFLQSIDYFDNKADFEKVIKATFYFGRKTINEMYYDYEALYNKLFYSSKHPYENDEVYKEFILNLLKTAPTPYIFETTFIAKILEKIALGEASPLFHKEVLNIPKQELINILNTLFESYLKDFKTFSDEILWNIYENTRIKQYIHVGGNQYQSRFLNNVEAHNMIIKLIERNLDDFLVFIIVNNPNNEKTFGVANVILEIFDEINDFKTFINNLDESNYQNLKEFKEFYTNYEANGYSSIEFNWSDNFFKEVR